MATKGGLLEGKRGLIIGVANKRSIAWGIAQKVSEAGAQLCLTYQNERLGENVRELAAELKNPLLTMMDVGSDSQIVMAFDEIRKKWGRLDFVVHAVAYAPRQALEHRFVETSRGTSAWPMTSAPTPWPPSPTPPRPSCSRAAPS